MNNMTEPCTASAPKQPKFQELLNQAEGVNGIITHLKELNSLLGISYDEVEQPAEPVNPNAPTLVRMLDELPNELAKAHSEIHDMINCIMGQLN